MVFVLVWYTGEGRRRSGGSQKTLLLKFFGVWSSVHRWECTWEHPKDFGIGGAVVRAVDEASCSVEEVHGDKDSAVGGSGGGESSSSVHTSRKLRMSSPGLS